MEHKHACQHSCAHSQQSPVIATYQRNVHMHNKNEYNVNTHQANSSSHTPVSTAARTLNKPSFTATAFVFFAFGPGSGTSNMAAALTVCRPRTAAADRAPFCAAPPDDDAACVARDSACVARGGAFIAMPSGRVFDQMKRAVPCHHGGVYAPSATPAHKP